MHLKTLNFIFDPLATLAEKGTIRRNLHHKRDAIIFMQRRHVGILAFNFKGNPMIVRVIRASENNFAAKLEKNTAIPHLISFNLSL